MARTMISDVPRPHYPWRGEEGGPFRNSSAAGGAELGPIQEGPTVQALEGCLCLVFFLRRGNVR